MKVALVNGERLPIPPVLGGAIEQIVYETALAIRNPALTVISRWLEALKQARFDGEIFHHVNVKAQTQKAAQALGRQVGRRFESPRTATQFYYLNGVTDLLEVLDSDTIEVHNRPEFVPYLKREFPDMPVILFMHNRADISNPRVQAGLESGSYILFVSHFLADRFVAGYPQGAAKACVIHNSVDTREWTPALKDHPKTEAIRQQYGLREGRTVLFVGRTVPEKGIHHLLDAVDLTRRLVPGMKLLVVGSLLFGAVSDSGFLRRLKRRAAQMGDAVIFTGYVDPYETPYFYGAADVTVVPSVWDEPFGKVVIESLACGVPVIGSRRGGIPEILSDGQEGFLVDNPADVALLAHRIVEMLLDADFRSLLGRQGRRKVVRHFSNAVRFARLKHFYESLENHRQTV